MLLSILVWMLLLSLYWSLLLQLLSQTERPTPTSEHDLAVSKLIHVLPPSWNLSFHHVNEARGLKQPESNPDGLTLARTGNST